MKEKGSLLILLLLAGVIVYAATRKRKGSIEIGPLDKGEFITDPADLLTDEEKSMFEI
jgi:hypothetical protein